MTTPEERLDNIMKKMENRTDDIIVTVHGTYPTPFERLSFFVKYRDQVEQDIKTMFDEARRELRVLLIGTS